MTNILHDLYDGKIIPWERHNPKSEEQLKLSRDIESEVKYFTDSMSPEDRERFEKLLSLYTELSGSEDVGFFAYSFTLGVRFMIGVMMEGESEG